MLPLTSNCYQFLKKIFVCDDKYCLSYYTKKFFFKHQTKIYDTNKLMNPYSLLSLYKHFARIFIINSFISLLKPNKPNMVFHIFFLAKKQQEEKKNIFSQFNFIKANLSHNNNNTVQQNLEISYIVTIQIAANGHLRVSRVWYRIFLINCQNQEIDVSSEK